MGVYNCFGKKGIQLKVGNCALKDYQIGDKVDIPDGVYIGYGGVVVIKDGIFIADFDNLTDKWGGVITPRNLL